LSLGSWYGSRLCENATRYNRTPRVSSASTSRTKRRPRAAFPTRRVESLDQCTPAEKAQLGLWRMIGEMLGESRRLHPSAERYQRAAYQRQAAQRLVSMRRAKAAVRPFQHIGNRCSLVGELSAGRAEVPSFRWQRWCLRRVQSRN
jgi:hypothetical protein